MLIRRAVAMLVGALAFPALALAQSSAEITGIVKDTSGAILPGVSVEAASPALIEKTKTGVSDARGVYRIVDLRPGTYTLTFTLSGFGTVKRQGIELNSGFNATIDAELKVGALEESVTVTGASPIIDVQNVRTQQVMTRAILDNLPTAQTISSFSALTLGSNVSGVQSGSDVGGNQGEQGFVIIHGTRSTDMKYMQNGMNTNNAMSSGGGIFKAGHNMNQLAISEVQMSYSAAGAEFETAGAQFNFIPKDGGNRFTGASRFQGTNENFQSTNLNDDLRSRGVTSSQRVKHVYDAGFAVGGPLRNDKLWFFTAHRWWGNEEYQANAFFNSAQGTGRYVADLNRRAYYTSHSLENGVNLTWQLSKKDKVTYYTNYSTTCTCYQSVSATTAPEASFSQKIPANLNQASWTRTQSNRILLEAGWTYLPVRWHIFHNPSNVGPNDPQIVEQSTGLVYNAFVSTALPYNDIDAGPGNGTTNRNQSIRGSMSYVTGSHNFKTGATGLFGRDTRSGAQNVVQGFGPVGYRLLNGVPNQITMYASPNFQTQSFVNTSLFAQDQWNALPRLTLNLGIRADLFEGSYPDQEFPASTFIPSVRIPGRKGVPSTKDLSPRFGAAIQLTSDGQTVLKVAHGRYVQSLGAGFPQSINPANTIVQSVTRTWTDANQNFFPDGDPRNPVANGELGPTANLAFGTPVANITYDDQLLNGNRGYTWQSSFVFERQVVRNMRVSVGYFRTSNGNFTVTDNIRVTPDNFSTYCVTAPSDTRLGSVSGTQVCGLYDVNPAQFGQVQNVVKPAQDFGDYSDVFNGFDIGMSARFGRGGIVQGGVALGRQVIDNCFTVDSPQGNAAAGTPGLYNCRDVKRWWDNNGQVKASWSYPLPWNMQFAGVFQNLAGLAKQANAVFSNAQIAPSLGRNLSAGANATASVPLLYPDTVFENRLTQIDLRLGANVRLGRIRMMPAIDLYNVTNANTVSAIITTYGSAWGTPTRFTDGRLLKFGVQLDF